jgi:hypothetical protein
VHVAELLGPLLWISDIEVVIARLPEVHLSRLLQNLRSALLQHLKRGRERGDSRFSDEQVDVFGHEDIAGDYELTLLPNSFELVLEDGVCAGSREERETVITTECDEVETAGILDSN